LKLAQSIKRALDPIDGYLVFSQNGIPFWFTHDFGGFGNQPALPNIDPNGEILTTLDANRVIGCVLQLANHIVTEDGSPKNASVRC